MFVVVCNVKGCSLDIFVIFFLPCCYDQIWGLVYTFRRNLRNFLGEFLYGALSVPLEEN